MEFVYLYFFKENRNIINPVTDKGQNNRNGYKSTKWDNAD